MGIPGFFLSIIKNKFYKNVHSGVKNGAIQCDYFMMDYNGIVYKAYERVKKQLEGDLTKDKIEEIIIDEDVRYTKYLICDVVKPTKLTYFALDGPAPRAKMIQQRSRRYKGYYDKVYMEGQKKKFKIDENKNEWDRSANISPGTVFMKKLSDRLLSIMKTKGFSTHNNKMQVLLSNSNVPGEGEHKFLPLVREMRLKKSTENFKVYLYGSDADLIVLALSTHKNNMHVIKEMQEVYELKNQYDSYEFLDLNIDNLGNAFNHDLTKTFKDHHFDKMRILNDYVFLTFLNGNDFVLSMPFLKIRKDGLKMLIAIYHDIKLNHDGYLVNYQIDKEDPPTINIAFFKELMEEIGKKEDFEMKRQQLYIESLMSGKKDFKFNRRIEQEKELTPFEIFQSRYTHLEVCSPDHPLFEKYHEEFKKINHKQEYEIWKEEYYKYYLNISKKNEEEYLKIRMDVAKNYLESLMFAIKYYFQGVPSWQWHYEFRMPPLVSDILMCLDKINMNEIIFEEGKPYTPYQQLMLILPPQMNTLLPAPLRPIMTDDKLLCTQFYPIEFISDVVFEIKLMYSEAILPEIDTKLLMDTIKTFESKLSEEETLRNTISSSPVMG